MENNLKYASPERLGIPSQAIIDFADELRELRFPIHSILFMRRGFVAAEGYCKPFDAHKKHRMYSVSKSFTSAGIGMIITADTQAINNAGDAIRFAHYRLLDKLSNKPLAENPTKFAEMKERLNSLYIPLPAGVKTTPRAGEFSGKTYRFEENRSGFKWMRANIHDDKVSLEYENKTGEHSFDIFIGEYKRFKFPEQYYGARIGARDREYDSISAGAWATDNTLLGIVYAVDDHLGTLKMQLTFSKDELTVMMTKAAEWFFGDYNGCLAGHALKQ